ncbi:hypothetical protein REPUB_Repub08aG0220100 [Reevesia pubescens]
MLRRAKEEQVEIIKRRPSSQKGLTFNEIRQMKYLSKVIDETLRISNTVNVIFRKAKVDVDINAGSFIPFGAGSRTCPEADLTKLEASIFLHYFLLNYRLERINPSCPMRCPSPTPIDNCLAKITKLSSNDHA